MNVRLEMTPEHLEIESGDRRERVEWRDLVEVRIQTTDEGPWIEDVFFLLRGQRGGVIVDHGLAQEIDLLENLQRLDGFDHLAVVAAMGSTSNASFLCWAGEPASGLAAAPEKSRFATKQIAVSAQGQTLLGRILVAVLLVGAAAALVMHL